MQRNEDGFEIVVAGLAEGLHGLFMRPVTGRPLVGNLEVVMAADVVNDGMGLELTDLGSSESGPALEAFWHDDGSGFDFIVHNAGTLPFAVVERFVAAARKTLPPTNEA